MPHQHLGVNMQVTNTMESLLASGFSRRMGQEYLDTLAKEESSTLFEDDLRTWSHAHGFFAETVACLGITEANADDYLSDYDYFRVWPLNSWQRVWINDKLTLKYQLSGTPWDRYLPKYYFYAGADGLVPLADSGLANIGAPVPSAAFTSTQPAKRSDFRKEFLALLREVGEFACKPANAELAVGFHKLSYDGGYLIDNRPATEDDVWGYVQSHPNDIFTEFFHPGGSLAEVSPVIHTLRVLVVNQTGIDPTFTASYLRLATDVAGDDSKANYRSPDEAGIRSYNLSFDLESGAYGNGLLVYGDKSVPAATHPDTGVKGAGKMECWQELRQAIYDVSLRLGPVEYLGYDVCATTDGPKIMEINSHSGSKYLQLYKPFMRDAYLADYFERKLAAIDSLDDIGRTRRNAIVR